MRSREELGDAVMAITRDPAPAGLAERLRIFVPGDLPQLALHASRHRVAPFLGRALAAVAIDPGAEGAAALARTHAHWTATHLMALVDLGQLRTVLTGAGVPFLVVKGPVLSERYYPSPDLRTYEDIDVLVAPSEFPRAVDALEAAGTGLVDRNWALIRSEGRAQLHLRLSMGTIADVHWHLFNRGRVRAAFDVSTDELIERARTVDLDGVATLTLDPVDTLLHLCVHATLSGGDRVIWAKDIERALVTDRPSWDAVIARARAWRAGPSVAIALARASHAAGAVVPAEVLDALYGSKLRRAITKRMDRRHPLERSVGEMSAAVLWSQTCRDRWPATIGALAGRASRRSRHALRSDHDGTTPIFREVGDKEDERAYLREVGDEPGRDRGGS